MDEHVEFPMNKFAFFELAGPVRATEIVILIVIQDELEEGRWTSLDKIDRYFYETIYQSAQTKW